MAAAPTTLIQPGAGGPVLNDFCECVCGIPQAVLYTSQRSATAGPAYDPVYDPTRVAGEIPFSVAQSRLAAAPYSAYAPGVYLSGANAAQFAPLASVKTSWGSESIVYAPDPVPPNTPYTATTTNTMSVSTDTDPHADGSGYPTASASLAEAKYKLRVVFQYPWRGDSTLTVSWRERTVHYSLLFTSTVVTHGNPDGTQTSDPPAINNDETARFSYKAFSEQLTPAQGAMYVETSEHDLPAAGLNLGDSVSITGPAEIGAFFDRVYGVDNVGGILVTAFEAVGYKNGFLPYIRPHASAGSGEASEPVEIYATETASVAEGFPTQNYSGAQSVQAADQVANALGAYPQNTFSADVPSALWSQLDGSAPPTPPAVVLTPTRVQWAQGLVMTLSNPIPTSALTDFVAAALANAPAPMFNDVSGILSLRNLPADELSYVAKQATQQGYLDIVVDSGILSLAPVQSPPGVVPAVALLMGALVAVTVDLLTTDLDTGVQTDSQLSFTFTLTTTDVGAQALTLTQGDPVSVPIPATNQMITWSNPQVTTATLDRWCVPPQVVVNDA